MNMNHDNGWLILANWPVSLHRQKGSVGYKVLYIVHTAVLVNEEKFAAIVEETLLSGILQQWEGDTRFVLLLLSYYIT